jgi:hypothetical protein
MPGVASCYMRMQGLHGGHIIRPKYGCGATRFPNRIKTEPVDGPGGRDTESGADGSPVDTSSDSCTAREATGLDHVWDRSCEGST